MDKWLRRIWLVNGVAILLGIIFLLAKGVIDLLPSRSNPSGPISTTQGLPQGIDSTILQVLRPELPLRVGRTQTMYIALQTRDLTTAQPQSSYRIMRYSGESGGNAQYTNIIFVGRTGVAPRLLLDRKAFISYADIPTEIDSLRTYCLFEIAFHDTDGDGRISGGDSTDLYVADLDGQNLSTVLPPGFAVEVFAESDNRQTLYVRAGKRPADLRIPQEDWPEKLFAYDIKARHLRSFADIDSALSVANRILWSK